MLGASVPFRVPPAPFVVRVHPVICRIFYFKEIIMGHFIFCVLHLLAILFGVVGLIITVPLHLIYSATKK
ncbi:MAG: hypothetical protein KGY70_19995 [Bacteroidales bacterium]|nr:hypothetical protein [Bacteroidales bacterium]